MEVDPSHHHNVRVYGTEKFSMISRCILGRRSTSDAVPRMSSPTTPPGARGQVTEALTNQSGPSSHCHMF